MKFSELKRRDELRVISSNAEVEGEPPSADKSLVIEVKGARLDYPIGAFRRGSLKASIMGLFGRREALPKPLYVNAIRGVDLRISHGERVALIGHNGSGKSSLLRILAGIYPLVEGEVTVTGRISTLLDVGLGFETESTGRENIYYRGMTMGYSRQQLQEVEEEIIKFADLGEFIDMPVRTYSAGMYVRLGFAISTQFVPDILLVDEVFGAGDMGFARRALKRMTNIVNNSGIFVLASHDAALVERICNRVIWLERGQIASDGPPSVVLPEYARRMSS